MSSLEHLKYALIRTIVNTSLAIRRSAWLSPATQPDRLKSYPCRPNLFPCRIFIPRGLDDGRLFPLVIRAHGGGLIVNNPSLDDPLARHVADHAGCIVVSIDYEKSPRAKFPTAYEDIIAQSLAVLEDEDLPLDRRMVFSGHSAGGNLLLGAAQDERIKGKLEGVSAVYPVTDMTIGWEEKMKTRPDPGVPDFIGPQFDTIKRLYLDPASCPPLEDVRLSPGLFAKRDDFPEYVQLIGAEHDMFCHEDEVMADKLARMEGKPKIDLDLDLSPGGCGCGWKAGGITWYKIPGQRHAFDNFPVRGDPEAERERVRAVDALYEWVTDWVVEVVSSEAGAEREEVTVVDRGV